MNSELDRQAILLLCAPLPGAEKPLTPGEYNLLVSWLVERQKRPGDLLDSDLKGLLQVPKLERVPALLGRQLGLGLEEWSAAGLWVLTRADDQYPARWKRWLGRSAPPLVFGAGEKTLLTPARSVGVVGSRDCSEEGLAFCRCAGRRAAEEGFTLVSGGARGADREAMQAAFDAGGTVIGVLADSLRKEALSKRYREMIGTGRVALLSPFGPDSRFTAGTAMARNRLVYTFCDATLVADSDLTGGTWSGAEENRKNWGIPVYVRTGAHEGEGNRKLIELGALPLTESQLESGWDELFPKLKKLSRDQMELFAVSP